MGPGHLAIAFAAKPAAPKAPLWILLIANIVLDLLTYGFKAIGMEDFGRRSHHQRHPGISPISRWGCHLPGHTEAKDRSGA